MKCKDRVNLQLKMTKKYNRMELKKKMKKLKSNYQMQVKEISFNNSTKHHGQVYYLKLISINLKRYLSISAQ